MCSLYMCGPQQATAMDHLSQVPKELLLHIIQHICSENDDNIVNQSLLAMRCSSKTLAGASDCARPSIKLHPSHLMEASSYLAKLPGLMSVTIHGPASDTPFPCNLGMVSSAVPKLTSLTLGVSPPDQIMYIHDIDLALLPWRHTLKHLTLSGCVLTETSENKALSQQSWCPNLPDLTSFVMAGGDLLSLCFGNCISLSQLDLKAIPLLNHVEVMSITTLQSVVISGNRSLAEIDLSACSQLKSLICTTNSALIRMDVSGCSALQNLACNSNTLLTSLSLHNCGLLGELVISNSTSLLALDATQCSMLRRIYCYSNSLLHSLKLPKQSSLELLFCVDCDSLSSLDVSGMCMLKQLGCGRNDLLTSIVSSGCNELDVVMCHDNTALASLDVSRCGALRAVECSGSPILASLNLSGCTQLKLLNRKGCHELGAIDDSSCPNLVQCEEDHN